MNFSRLREGLELRRAVKAGHGDNITRLSCNRALE